LQEVDPQHDRQRNRRAAASKSLNHSGLAKR
jgi:hypothetical protein